MNAIELRPRPNLRRWCRECGLPSPATMPECANCGVAPQVVRTVKNLSPIFNEGNGMVQNNVLNVDTVGLICALDYDDEPAPVAPQGASRLQRVFMITCTIALWIGIICSVCVMGFIATLVWLALTHA